MRLTSATADPRVVVDVLVPPVMEENVEVVEYVQEWTSERTREQFVAVPVP